MKRWYDEERGAKMCEPDCVDEWLFDIWAIGCDYDGCHTEKDLKKLVDELVSMANKARECLWEWRLFGNHGEPKPKTNADLIRAMSNEELGRFCVSLTCGPVPQNPADYHKWFMEWLKQPAKDGEGE